MRGGPSCQALERSEPSMDSNRSRTAVLVGLAAAVGAFGVAVMISAATAPTARADVLTDVINAVDADYAAGQGDFTTALTDFGSGDLNDGLAALFSGVDTDLVGIPSNLEIGAAELLTNRPSLLTSPFTVEPEPDFTSALTDAESAFAAAQESFTEAATALSLGDYDYLDVLFVYSAVSVYEPLQLLLEGIAASTG
jgi:hypothetical protein